MSVPPRHRFRVGQKVRLTSAGLKELDFPPGVHVVGVVHAFSPRCPRCVYVHLDDSGPHDLVRVFGHHIEALP